jgi:tyrosyl-tRNA synthetase
MPLLEGTDGAAKMSKSLGNTIGLTDEPVDMFGRTMRLPDELIVKYLRLATDLDPDLTDDIAARLSDRLLSPRDAKRRLAWELVRMYHSAAVGGAASRGYGHRRVGV